MVKGIKKKFKTLELETQASWSWRVKNAITNVCVSFSAGDAIIIVNFTAIKKGREIRDVSLTAVRYACDGVHRDSPGENVPSAKYINEMANGPATVCRCRALPFSTSRAP